MFVGTKYSAATMTSASSNSVCRNDSIAEKKRFKKFFV